VGASMKVRLQSFNAMQREIDVEKQKISIIDARIATEGENLYLTNERIASENKVLGLMTEQAGTVKALRDNWISAIGAANSGAGKFSKIVMGQQELTAGVLKIAKESAVLSSYSGAFTGGYQGSEQLGVGGGIRGAHKNVAYETEIDKMLGGRGGARAFEMQGRAGVQQIVGDLGKRSQLAMSGGGGTLALSASPFLKSAALGQGGFGGVGGTGGISPVGTAVNVNLNAVRVNVEIKDMDNLATTIAKKMTPVLEDLGRNIASQLAGGYR